MGTRHRGGPPSKTSFLFCSQPPRARPGREHFRFDAHTGKKPTGTESLTSPGSARRVSHLVAARKAKPSARQASSGCRLYLVQAQADNRHEALPMSRVG